MIGEDRIDRNGKETMTEDEKSKKERKNEGREEERKQEKK